MYAFFSFYFIEVEIEFHLGKNEFRARLLFAQSTTIIWLSLYGCTCVFFKASELHLLIILQAIFCFVHFAVNVEYEFMCVTFFSLYELIFIIFRIAVRQKKEKILHIEINEIKTASDILICKLFSLGRMESKRCLLCSICKTCVTSQFSLSKRRYLSFDGRTFPLIDQFKYN